MDAILTFDVGTTAIKTGLFRRDLTCLAIRTDEYHLCTEGGMVELDSNVYWDTICCAVARILKEHPEAQVKAISLTTQGETLIPVDCDGKPLHRAVIWLDDRAKTQAKKITAHLSGEDLYHYTGVTDMNGFVPLAKLLWFLEEQSDIYHTAHKFLLLEDFLLHRLTGRFVTEKSLLTSTAWYDIRNDRYWSELLCQLGLDENKLPQIVDCGQLVGTLTETAAQALGLDPFVQVFAGAMDQIAAAIGGGGLQDGVVTATVGTAMVLTSAISSMDECRDNSLILYRGIHDKQYVILPLCPTAGAVFKWYKDQCSALIAKQCKSSGEDVYDFLCQEASMVAPGSNGVLLLPYFAGCMQPQCLPDIRGVFFGLNLTTDHATMTRSVLESIGYMLRENIQMLRTYGLHPVRIHFFGGGSKNQIWNQIIADITDTELALLEQSECGCLGAAMIGAVSMGWYDSLEESQKQNKIKQIVCPNPTLREIYDQSFKRYQILFQKVASIFQETKGV